MTENFDLERFQSAQDKHFDSVMDELRRGRKTTHWMWYVFPQVCGLGHSPLSMHYAIPGLDEARAYLSHPVLGPRLLQATELVLEHADLGADAIFGYPDSWKLRSCMTLFERVAEPANPFVRVLDGFFDAERDPKTLAILSQAAGKNTAA